MSLRYEQHYIQNPHVFGSMNTYPKNVNFHQRTKNPPLVQNNNFLLGQNSPPKSYQSLGLNNSVNQLPNDSKVSYARNIKQRLFQTDQLQEAKKQLEKLSYRQELQLQMKQDKERKQKEKEKIQKQELERERKFYAQVGKIKAQEPKPKQEPSYLILRSRKGDRNKHKTERNLESMDQSRSRKSKDSSRVQQLHMPKIMKRGGYHNQSTLDNITLPEQAINQSQNNNQQHSRSLPQSRINHPSETQQRKLQIIRQRNYEQERISNIIKLQEKMIRKLEYFKQQILKSNNQFNTDKEVQQIRNILKSKPIKLEVFSVRNDDLFNNNHDFYSFPKVDNRIMTRSRNRNNRSRVNQGIDLNQRENNSQNQQQRILTEQNQQENDRHNLNHQFHSSRNKKRQIKLFHQNNDKNYRQPDIQNEQNPQINSIPVLLTKKHIPPHKNESYDE